MTPYKPIKILIDQNIQNHWMTKRIVDYYSSIPKEIIDSSEKIDEFISNEDDPITEGKKYLYLTVNKGSFVKKCPGTTGFICCNYYVIDLVENCHLDCSYCFLQNYLNNKFIKVYVNIEDLFEELETLLSNTDKFYRIGTGELSDSLALDEAGQFSSLLIEYFSKKENALIELKTKTNQIQHLLNSQQAKNTVVSWSLNPDHIIEQEELKTSSLSDRLKSAYLCQESGYKLAFHFDPIIYYPDWKKDYQEVIDRLFDKINPNNIVWISLGGFRYSPQFKKVIQERFEQSTIIYNEFLESPDGKMRYFIKIREELYNNMLSMLKEKDPNLLVYLCMEGKYMWKKIYGFTPQNHLKLDSLFRQRLSQTMGK